MFGDPSSEQRSQTWEQSEMLACVTELGTPGSQETRTPVSSSLNEDFSLQSLQLNPVSSSLQEISALRTCSGSLEMKESCSIWSSSHS